MGVGTICTGSFCMYVVKIGIIYRYEIIKMKYGRNLYTKLYYMKPKEGIICYTN